MLLNLGKFSFSLLNNCDGFFSDSVEFFLSSVDGCLKFKNLFLEFFDLKIDLVEARMSALVVVYFNSSSVWICPSSDDFSATASSKAV